MFHQPASISLTVIRAIDDRGFLQIAKQIMAVTRWPSLNLTFSSCSVRRPCWRRSVVRLSLVQWQSQDIIQRLNQALVNNEVTEVSNKTILHELQEARSTISRLTAQHARSVGWENRLATLSQEKDDMQQERDGESNRAKLAESRFSAMKDKTGQFPLYCSKTNLIVGPAKLQSEVRRLQDVLAERRLHRLESSEHVLQDARTRIEALYNSVSSPLSKLTHPLD